MSSRDHRTHTNIGLLKLAQNSLSEALPGPRFQLSRAMVGVSSLKAKHLENYTPAVLSFFLSFSLSLSLYLFCLGFTLCLCVCVSFLFLSLSLSLRFVFARLIAIGLMRARGLSAKAVYGFFATMCSSAADCGANIWA